MLKLTEHEENNWPPRPMDPDGGFKENAVIGNVSITENSDFLTLHINTLRVYYQSIRVVQAIIVLAAFIIINQVNSDFIIKLHPPFRVLIQLYLIEAMPLFIMCLYSFWLECKISKRSRLILEKSTSKVFTEGSKQLLGEVRDLSIYRIGKVYGVSLRLTPASSQWFIKLLRFGSHDYYTYIGYFKEKKEAEEMSKRISDFLGIEASKIGKEKG